MEVSPTGAKQLRVGYAEHCLPTSLQYLSFLVGMWALSRPACCGGCCHHVGAADSDSPLAIHPSLEGRQRSQPMMAMTYAPLCMDQISH